MTPAIMMTNRRRGDQLPSRALEEIIVGADFVHISTSVPKSNQTGQSLAPGGPLWMEEEGRS